MSSEDTKILEFNQYCKSDKPTFIVYADLESLILKINDAKIILKNYLRQTRADIFRQVSQCLQYYYLKAYKISMMYTEVKIA